MLSHLLLESSYNHSIKQNLFEHLLRASRGDSKMHKQPCPTSNQSSSSSFGQCLGEGPHIFVEVLVNMTSCFRVLSAQGRDAETWVEEKAQDLGQAALDWNQG